ncbi:MAG: rod shape-determining protein MreC [Candidatus Geothermincolia bacterium]
MYRERQHNRATIIILSVVCIILVTLYSRESQNGLLHRVQRLSLDIVAPLQSGVSKLVSPVRDGFDYLSDVKGAITERDDLLKENLELKSQITDMLGLERENANFKALLDYKENNPSQRFLAASVIGENPNNWEQTIQISAGYDDGVREWMAVLTEEGLVGRVVLCTAHTSMVQLITDDKSQVGARLQGSGEEGLVKGAGKYDPRLQLINQDAEVREGDLVLTSGSGGTCPAGIPIGAVTEITEKRPDLSRGISIRPAVAFSRLQHVLVVISPLPRQSASAEEEGE